MKAQWLDRALMLSPIRYTVCTTEAMFRAELNRMMLPLAEWPAFLKTPQSNATVHYFEHTPRARYVAIVCMHPAPERDQLEVVGLLVHEAVHLWQWICDHIGETAPSAEFEAYSVQSISQSLLGEYRRQVYGDPT